ncbi:hypothetical protein EIP91_001266 [Steccherinum ochraceum]|uniref:Uncharacterized protein n=1 Tax=Steccherinum ochraceum TaxID=92696 RepID=A0A4R0RKS8_9APHY|nr:hypothetical protein EIP91_001266 [Steccherinum ochraceum]
MSQAKSTSMISKPNFSVYDFFGQPAALRLLQVPMQLATPPKCAECGTANIYDNASAIEVTKSTNTSEMSFQRSFIAKFQSTMAMFRFCKGAGDLTSHDTFEAKYLTSLLSIFQEFNLYGGQALRLEAELKDGFYTATFVKGQSKRLVGVVYVPQGTMCWHDFANHGQLDGESGSNVFRCGKSKPILDVLLNDLWSTSSGEVKLLVVTDEYRASIIEVDETRAEMFTLRSINILLNSGDDTEPSLSLRSVLGACLAWFPTDSVARIHGDTENRYGLGPELQHKVYHHSQQYGQASVDADPSTNEVARPHAVEKSTFEPEDELGLELYTDPSPHRFKTEADEVPLETSQILTSHRRVEEVDIRQYLESGPRDQTDSLKLVVAGVVDWERPGENSAWSTYFGYLHREGSACRHRVHLRVFNDSSPLGENRSDDLPLNHSIVAKLRNEEAAYKRLEHWQVYGIYKVKHLTLRRPRAVGRTLLGVLTEAIDGHSLSGNNILRPHGRLWTTTELQSMAR